MDRSSQPWSGRCGRESGHRCVCGVESRADALGLCCSRAGTAASRARALMDGSSTVSAASGASTAARRRHERSRSNQLSSKTKMKGPARLLQDSQAVRQCLRRRHLNHRLCCHENQRGPEICERGRRRAARRRSLSCSRCLLQPPHVQANGPANLPPVHQSKQIAGAFPAASEVSRTLPSVQRHRSRGDSTLSPSSLEESTGTGTAELLVLVAHHRPQPAQTRGPAAAREELTLRVR